MILFQDNLFIMHTLNIALLFSVSFGRGVVAQITGSYPVQITGTGNDTGVDAANLSNYPACAVRWRSPEVETVLC